MISSYFSCLSSRLAGIFLKQFFRQRAIGRIQNIRLLLEYENSTGYFCCKNSDKNGW